jgi:hypothetical protein
MPARSPARRRTRSQGSSRPRRPRSAPSTPPPGRSRSLRRDGACPPPCVRTPPVSRPPGPDPASPSLPRRIVARARSSGARAQPPSRSQPSRGPCSPRERQASRGRDPPRAGRAADAHEPASRRPPQMRRGNRAGRKPAMSPCEPRLLRLRSACKGGTPGPGRRTPRRRRRATTPPSSGPRIPQASPRRPPNPRSTPSQRPSVARLAPPSPGRADPKPTPSIPVPRLRSLVPRTDAGRAASLSRSAWTSRERPTAIAR